ncbi:MAG TPA: cytochrome b/b6 domain-containing protein [Burkholderiaceae bacterium]|jgi:thiosulfate reductase cytochrome b subunit|nr:cytochrome b/b6 domain-containing protein [Burkholderiaceae bacterium]
MNRPDPDPADRRIYRHRLPVRVMHWINVVCMTILLMSGLQIFNAHPALYWGRDSEFTRPWLSMNVRQREGRPTGVTTVAGRSYDTDGVLGRSQVNGQPAARGFPAWATIPGPQWLAMGRRWHFFFAWIFVANGAAYLLYTIFSGHLRRDLLPTGWELRHIGSSLRDHLLLRHPTGEAARRYNVLQNIAYLLVVFVLVPLLVIAGMGMSPTLNSVFPGWVDWLGGRQSARSIHFIVAMAVLAFVLIHLFEVIVNGVWNELRSMITGYYRLPRSREGEGR